MEKVEIGSRGEDEGGSKQSSRCNIKNPKEELEHNIRDDRGEQLVLRMEMREDRHTLPLELPSPASASAAEPATGKFSFFLKVAHLF